MARLILHAGGAIGISRPAGGKSKLDPALPNYFAAARHQRMKWFVLRDLDNDEKCAPRLRGALLKENDPRLCFRIAVREAESWLMSDARSLAAFLKVSENRIPEAPDSIGDPKQALVSLARKSSRLDVRAALVPHPRSGLSSGPEYASWMTKFAAAHWNIADAVESQRSPSLVKAVSRLKELVAL